MVSDKKVENAVGAILLRDDEILLVKRKKHYTDMWTLPVGILEFGETTKDCIVREVKEELGVDFISPQFCGYSDGIGTLPGRHFVMLYFYGSVHGEIKLEVDELADYKWFPIHEILKMKLGFNQEDVVQRFYDDHHKS